MNKRIIALIVLVVTVAAALVSCGEFSEETGIELKTKTEIIAQCLKTGDLKKAYSYMDKEYITEEEFVKIFPEMVEYVGKFSEYTVSGPTGFNSGINNGVSYVQATYLVDTDNKDFYVVVGTVEERSELSTFRVTLKSDADVASGKVSGNIIGDSPFQIVVLAIGLASFGFSIWMLFDCIKKNIKKKPLWIVVIILGQLTLLFTAGTSQINFNFNIGFILSLSTLAISESLTVLKIIIPLGAIIYRIRRRKLIINDDPAKDYSQLSTWEDYENIGLPNDYGNKTEKNEAEDQRDGEEKTEVSENEGKDEK